MNYLEFEKRQRQTGRTTRMIEEAKKLAKEGKQVYVIVNDPREGKALKERHKIPADAWVVFTTFEDVPGYDYRRGVVPNSNPDRVAVLVDHYAIEMRFGAMMRLMHRYDKDAT